MILSVEISEYSVNFTALSSTNLPFLISFIFATILFNSSSVEEKVSSFNFNSNCFNTLNKDLNAGVLNFLL
ncbi:MAG: Uncharacterised protein [Arcobacter lacus]|nr:MAG: Uncharacterised protein [Arcobacter lacus]